MVSHLVYRNCKCQKRKVTIIDFMEIPTKQRNCEGRFLLREPMICFGAHVWIARPHYILTAGNGLEKTDLRKINKKLSSKYGRKLRNSSVSRKGQISENQSNIDVFIKDLKTGGKKNGRSDAG